MPPPPGQGVAEEVRVREAVVEDVLPGEAAVAHAARQTAAILGVAPLASGFASSSVGTMAGQVAMQGFIRRRIPLFALVPLLPIQVFVG
jgi:manganese transport protein